MTTSKDSLSRSVTLTELNQLKCSLEHASMLLQQLETAVEAGQLMDCSTSMKSEKSLKMDLELQLQLLELTQIVRRFSPLMQETLSALYSTISENAPLTTHPSHSDSMSTQPLSIAR